MIETERLILRGWRESDRAPFHAMGQDRRVMRFLGPALSLTDVDAAMTRQNAFLATRGHCFWAIERKADAAFLGFCGIRPGPRGTPIAARPEIGWRLAHRYWGKGYAREAAEESLRWAFAALPDDTVWSITTPGNHRSWGLMRRLGMSPRPDLDFDHPDLREGDPLRAHIVYAISPPAGA